jgi:hypothetical protein
MDAETEELIFMSLRGTVVLADGSRPTFVRGEAVPVADLADGVLEPLLARGSVVTAAEFKERLARHRHFGGWTARNAGAAGERWI